MDIREQEGTYGGFVKFSKYGIGFAVVLLIFLATLA